MRVPPADLPNSSTAEYRNPAHPRSYRETIGAIQCRPWRVGGGTLAYLGVAPRPGSVCALMPALTPPRPAVAFLCTHCETHLRAAGAMAGRSADCPGCDEPIIVPAVDPPEREAPGGGYESAVARVLAVLTA